MSQTISFGLVGPTYWAYTAFVMANRLLSIAEAETFAPADIPGGVRRDAQRFFDLILQSFNGGPPETMAASNNAYLIARDVIKRTSEPVPQTGEEIRQTIERYASFLRNLGEARDLSSDEVRMARELARFFTGLYEAGASERYLAGVHMEAPTVPSEPL